MEERGREMRGKRDGGRRNEREKKGEKRRPREIGE